MKQLVAILLCAAILTALFSACSPARETASAPETPGSQTESTQTESTQTESTQTASSQTQNKPAQQPAFTFQPKVASVYLYEVYGEDMVQTWFNIVDAVLAGEDSFACPDQETYDWRIYQFSDRCFPCFVGLFREDVDRPVENGVGHLLYTSTKEERETKIAAFEELVVDIINKTIKPEYTDMEKALALYKYFCDTYRYDYDTSNKMEEEFVEYLSSYRLLTTGTGVCQEISSAYSYLLMQVGVDATIMMGDWHQWSYVRINGKNYHIDPTFALENSDSLEFFMMNDEKRDETYPSDRHIIVGAYAQEHEHPDYVADDDTFRPIWNAFYERFDHAAHLIHGYTLDDNGESVPMTFDYAGF